MDETHVINQVKEDVCYVSQDFYKDMDIAKYVYNGTKCKSWYFWIICLYKQTVLLIRNFSSYIKEVLSV